MMAEQEQKTEGPADEEARYAELARRRAASRMAAKEEQEEAGGGTGENDAEGNREQGGSAPPGHATLIGQVIVGALFDGTQWLLAFADGGLVTGKIISSIALGTFYVWDRMKYPNEPTSRLATYLGVAGVLEFLPGLDMLPTWTAYPLRRYLQKHSRII